MNYVLRLILGFYLSVTLRGQSSSAWVDDLLGNWESIDNSGEVIIVPHEAKFFKILTFKRSSDGRLTLTQGQIDINQVKRSKYLWGAAIDENELRPSENGSFEYREEKIVEYKFGTGEIDKNRSKNRMLETREFGSIRTAFSGAYLRYCVQKRNRQSGCLIYRRGGEGISKLLAISAGLRKNTPHAAETASYFDAVERETIVGNHIFTQLTGTDVLASNKSRATRDWQDWQQKIRSEPRRTSGLEDMAKLAGAVALAASGANGSTKPRGSVANSRCQPNLGYLAPKIPSVPDSNLMHIRSSILSQDIGDAIAKIRAQGLTLGQAAQRMLQQARADDAAVGQTEACVRKSAQDPESILRALRARNYNGLHFGGDVLGSCIGVYIAADWARLANREAAIQVSCNAGLGQ